MAIIEAVPDVSAQVFVNGTPVPEFDNDDDNNDNDNTANSVTKYVEVTTGESFSVQCLLKPTFLPRHDFCVTLNVDGKYGDSMVYRAVRFVQPSGRRFTFEGKRESTGAGQFLRRFIFSGVTTNDSRLVAVSDDLKKTLKEVGTIYVKFVWVTIQGASANQKNQARTFTNLGTIPEKALKGRALSTQTEYGPQEAVHPFTVLTTKKLYDGKPFAEFNFKYRSRKDLKALLIIPRSPSPVPLEDRDIDSLNAEEMRELLRRQKERQKADDNHKIESVAVKKEHNTTRNRLLTDPGSEDDEILFVSSSKRRKLASTVDANGVETIDLI
ncbi:hypothetical protein P171DRAFT_434489 [Karstenula rhodostoma CBS 690.94]|uniref:DUF7918 domain-containing protein n=1 Tax=Karstenula rhodostoma CBS 690.94 TaxID=1392251 RepID=A0A9P4U834_9PLEO|nr:hypothetical protein P171DRAFT_434489 [Karstenula rhodostoma CBS 690.94]